MPSNSRLIALSLAITFLSTLSVSGQEPKEGKPALLRRDKSSDEDLRKQLLKTPEVGFDQQGATFVYGPLNKVKEGKSKGGLNPGTSTIPAEHGMNTYNQLAANAKKTDHAVLPWVMGADCQLGKETAERLQVFSVNLRLYMRRATPANDIRPDADKLRELLIGTAGNAGKVKGIGKRLGGGQSNLKWDRAEAVPTLVQMLQAEGESVRLLLVEVLGEIKGKDAGVALARRAMFDLSPEVREKAVEGLAKRPREDYEQTLIDGLRWPWAPAADHAAEALGALKQKDVVPALIKALKEPDPSLAYLEGKTHIIKEMVRINHLSNCTLCHGLSTSKQDLVRGRIPTPGQDMPPLYYAETTGLFIRADMTFLKQDFSVVQPVTNPSKWPGQQRYDYLLRTRKATTKEIQLLKGLEKDNKLADPYPQRDAVIFALKGITGMDRGNRPDSWMDLLNPIRDESKK